MPREKLKWNTKNDSHNSIQRRPWGTKNQKN